MKTEPYFQEGDIITHKSTTFRIGELLGRGAFAQCFGCTHNNQKYAMKIVKLNELKSNKIREKLESEIEIHSSVDHPNVVKFHSTFRDDEYCYMVLEFCANGDLDSLLKKHKKFSNSRSTKFFEDTLNAVEHIHKNNILHRDLKLSNLFLDDNFNVKIGDFGLAARIEEGQKKATVCGTPNYIAPEILFGKSGHSYEADLWSLGVILYTLLVGVPPFSKKDAKEIYKMIEKNYYFYPSDCVVSPAARSLIDSLLTTDPILRPTIRHIKNSKFLCPDIILRVFNNLSYATLENNITVDHPIYTIPLSKIEGIGYSMASGYSGVRFNDSTTMLYKKNSSSFLNLFLTRRGEKRVLKKEEHLITAVPPALKFKFEGLLYFARHFCVHRRSIGLLDVDFSFVIKVVRIEHGLLFLLFNEVVLLDFDDGLMVYIYADGNKVFSRRNGCVVFDERILRLAKSVVEEKIKEHSNDIK